jgi:hypothetical protein
MSLFPGHFSRYSILMILVISSLWLDGQVWECAKERDGIKIYTCRDTVSSYKLFKGEIDLHSDVGTVSKLIEDVRNFDIWDDDIKLIKILDSEPGKFIKYYVQYNVNWPFTDRDLCVEAKITTDPVTGVRIISAWSSPDLIPLDSEYVRILQFWQKWTIAPVTPGNVHLTLEGYAEPAGEVPAWMSNMAITNSPMNMLKKIRETLQ